MNTKMEIKILGTGGALNDGLPYNSFILNNELLCELPPDIMLSLNKNNIDYKNINKVFISHFHGDHIFGLPFFILSLFFFQAKGNQINKKSFYGPKGLKEKAIELSALAFTEKHPCINWMLEKIQFYEINHASNFSLFENYKTEYFELNHFIETFGFSLIKNGNIKFSYIADTLWNSNIEELLKKKPEIIITDLNGEPDDPIPVHLSEKDIIEKAFPLTGNRTKYYGTHLKENKKSNDSRINYLMEGYKIQFNL